MDVVAAHAWSFIIASFIAGYWAVCRIHRRTLTQPAILQPDIRDAEIEAELRAGHYIEALRLYRRRDGSGLKEAKAAVDAMARRLGVKT